MIDLNKLHPIVVLYCQSQGYTINPIKLQKLLYFIQAWHIAMFEKNTLWEELPEAWVNGPVYRSVYNIYKTKFYRNANFVYKNPDGEDISTILQRAINYAELTKKQQNFIFDILKVYGAMSDFKLVMLTHIATPWNNARKGLTPIQPSSNTIKVDDIYDYYYPLTKKGNNEPK